MRYLNGIKRFVSFFVGISVMASCLYLPCFSLNVSADSDPEQDRNTSVGTIDDVTYLHWIDESAATLSWTAVDNANYYYVTVEAYESDATTYIGVGFTGTDSTEIDVQDTIHNIVGETEYAKEVKVRASVFSQYKEYDQVVAQGNGVTTDFWSYQISGKPGPTPTPAIQAPKPTNMKLSEDYVLTYECNFENITKYDDTPPQYIDGNTGLLFFPLLYVTIYYIAPDGSVKTSESQNVCRMENNVGSIDLSYQVESDCKKFALSGQYQFYCEMHLNVELMEYEYSGLSKTSEISDPSNTISFDYVYIEPETTPIPTIQAPKPTNMKLSEDYVLTYECNFENITKYDDTPPQYIDGNTGRLFFPLLYVYVYYEAPDGSVVVSEPNYGSVCRLENNVGSIDLSYQIESDCKNFALSGQYQVYCEMYLNVELMEYEYSGLSKTSEISDPSNTISFDYVYIEPETTPIPTIQAPKPTNMKLSEDYVLTYECNFENITKYDDIPPQYIDGNTGILFFPLLYVYVYYEAPDGSVVVSEPNYGSVCRLENNVGSIDLSYQIENDYEEMNLNGPYKVYCSMYLNSELMDYEYGGLSKESEMSDYSNAVMISNTIPIESIVISPSQPVISLNNSYYLGKMVYPLNAHYDKIKWTSDNESIVSVSNTGLITGKAVGTANISASIWGVTATVPITVYSISSNVEDSTENTEVTSTAGDIIDGIINNSYHNIENTDILLEDADKIKEDIVKGIINGDTFHTDIVAIQQYFELYKDNWDKIQDAANELNVQFEGAYNIEVEMYHKDSDGNQHHIGNITQLDNEVSFSFELPSEMKEHQSDGAKKYILVRVHKNSDGTTEYSPIDYIINNDGTFTATSDRYSDFIWCSVDISSGTETQNPSSLGNNVSSKDNKPTTKPTITPVPTTKPATPATATPHTTDVTNNTDMVSAGDSDMKVTMGQDAIPSETTSDMNKSQLAISDSDMKTKPMVIAFVVIILIGGVITTSIIIVSKKQRE